MVLRLLLQHKCFALTIIGLLFSSTSFSQNDIRFQGEMENLGNIINSPYDEKNPTFSPDGSTLYFTRGRHPENTGGRNDPGDIWISRKDEAGNWTAAQHGGKNLNNGYFNAVIGFSPDGQTIYLQHHYFNQGIRPKTQGFSYATKKGEGWSTPQKASIDNFYNQSTHQSMAISANGKIMIMALNSFGSYGYEDLYVSFLMKDNAWTEPKNLGSGLNSSFQEMTPFLGKDNTTLYFASSGHGSIGSRDIFMTQRLDNSWRIWSEPQNITRINSEGIELSYTISPDEKYAYFVSTKNSDGYGDIHRIMLNPEFQPEDSTENLLVTEFVKPDTVIVISEDSITNDIAGLLAANEDTTAETNSIEVKGTIFSKKEKQPLKGKVNIIPMGDLQTPEPILVKVDNDGVFSAQLKKDVKYKVKLSSEGYMTEDTLLNLSTVSGAFLNYRFYLTKLEAGTTFQLNNVLFERGTSTLVDSSYLELDNVVEMMRENPEIKIEISGHTDNQGDARLNLKLSQERVETVLAYLIDKGIEKDRLIGKGYGGTRPIASNKSESTRKLNRRVEFTILQSDEGE